MATGGERMTRARTGVKYLEGGVGGYGGCGKKVRGEAIV